MARRDNIPLLDVENLLLQLPAAHGYKSQDGIHPIPEMMAKVCINLLLNMYIWDVKSSILESA